MPNIPTTVGGFSKRIASMVELTSRITRRRRDDKHYEMRESGNRTRPILRWQCNPLRTRLRPSI